MSIRFLALGDSYTIGEQVSLEACWPMQLAAALRTEQYAVAEPVILAKTGWTTAELLSGLSEANLVGPFDLVSLLIGVNNQYRGEPLGTYVVEFRELLKRAVGFAGGNPGRVAVLSIPDWGGTPFAAGRDADRIRMEIDAFNAVNNQEAATAGVHYYDITGLTREFGANPEMLAEDGLHPSGMMYAAWVQQVLPGFSAVLSEGAMQISG